MSSDLMNLLSGMFRPVEGMERNQPGYHHADGWNAALRQVMDYVNGGALVRAGGKGARAPDGSTDECTEAQRVCFQAYQVVGVLLSDLGIFDTDRAEKILDNLSQARLVHEDVLPWESVGVIN